MKGLVLSGGYGERLRPLTYSAQKQLIPVANKPVLFYGLEDLLEAGITQIGIVVGPNREQIMNAVESLKGKADIEFIYQDEPRGLAHAAKVSRDFIGDDSFVMYLGDNILREGIVRHVEAFKEQKADASILVVPIKNPERFGVAELDGKGRVRRLEEKPKVPPSNLALVGIYMFGSAIFEAIENIQPSWRNELEITDAIQYLIDKGYRVDASQVSGWWKDTGRPEDILEANRLILDDLKPSMQGTVEEGAVLAGRVDLGEGSVIKRDSTVKGPALIGRDCLIEGAYIGPYTSIGNGCHIVEVEIDDSVIMEGTKIIKAHKIVESLIGRDTVIEEQAALPRGLKLVIGDNSQVRL